MAFRLLYCGYSIAARATGSKSSRTIKTKAMHLRGHVSPVAAARVLHQFVGRRATVPQDRY